MQKQVNASLAVAKVAYMDIQEVRRKNLARHIDGLGGASAAVQRFGLRPSSASYLIANSQRVLFRGKIGQVLGKAARLEGG